MHQEHEYSPVRVDEERFYGRRPIYGRPFVRPFYGPAFGYGFGAPFLGGVLGGIVGSALFPPYGYGYPFYGGYGYPYYPWY